jgi:hypothetical protein
MESSLFTANGSQTSSKSSESQGIPPTLDKYSNGDVLLMALAILVFKITQLGFEGEDLVAAQAEQEFHARHAG